MGEFDLLTVMHAAMKILSTRVMTLVAMVMTFGLYCWAMSLGTTIALQTAAVFGFSVFLPALLADRKKESSNGTES